MKLCIHALKAHLPAGIYLLKVNSRNTRERCEICSKLTPCSSVSIVNFKHVIAGWSLLLQKLYNSNFHLYQLQSSWLQETSRISSIGSSENDISTASKCFISPPDNSCSRSNDGATPYLIKMNLEICYLNVFEKTITLMVSMWSLTQFTLNKRNQLVRLILD